MIFASVPLAKFVKDVSVPAKNNLETTEFSSDLRPLEPHGFAVASLSVPDQTSSAVMKRAKKSFAKGKSPRSWKMFATGGGKTKLTTFLASSRFANLLHFLRVGFLWLIVLMDRNTFVALHLLPFARGM